MRNPLRRRLPRELRRDAGKLLALFLFLTATIGFVSGFLVADGSMKTAYDNSFSQYSVEDGHFTLEEEADAALLNRLEEREVTIYPLFYRDRTLSGGHTIRVFANREQVNRASVLAGQLPEAADEIAIDRLYGENNDITLGDALSVDGRTYTVCGLIALSDYSALFKNNTDMMFDASKFTVALVSQTAFDAMGESGLQYCYAWRNQDQNLSDQGRKELSDGLKEDLMDSGLVTDFVAREDNQAITFTGEDMGSDRAMFLALLYIVMVVLAFVFAVTTRNTLEQEASVIGTLRASGYTRGELLRHYLTLPTLVTFLAALVGNGLGYTCMKGVVVALYYHSYSLPTYVTLWNGEAFLLTTAIPVAIILAVNLLVLTATLSLPPLQFLRHDLKRRQKKRVLRLPNWRFLTRFRIRVILQNLPAYLTLFVGIVLASLLLMFGMAMSPLLSNFKTEVIDSQIAKYQYILKAPVETEISQAERYCVTSLDTERGEEITVYGVASNSRYLDDLNLPAGAEGAVATEGYLEKYGLRVGDKVTLREPFGEENYTFTITGSYHYAAALALFLSQESFNERFQEETDWGSLFAGDQIAQMDQDQLLSAAAAILLPEEVRDTILDTGAWQFNGYFSDVPLTDLNEDVIASVITQEDLTVLADQLDDSMGNMFYLIEAFALLLYLLLLYLLAKLIVERNAQSISLVKILGYSDREAGDLYNSATAAVVVLSLCVSLPLCYGAMRGIYYLMMQELNGWLTFYMAPWIYPAMLAAGILCYGAVHLLQMRRIRRIPLSQVLKNME